jgi:SM-20-related protein
LSSDHRPPSHALLRRLGLYLADEFVSGALCQAVFRELAAASGSAAEVFAPAGAEVSPGTRNAMERIPGPAAESIASALAAAAPAIAAHFAVEIGTCEPVSFVTYGPGQYYRPHVDRGPSDRVDDARDRAISVVLFLNDDTGEPGERFDGGDLVFYDLLPSPPQKGLGFPLRPKAGLLAAFRSEVLHEVTPVTRGLRAVAVTWFHRAGL